MSDKLIAGIRESLRTGKKVTIDLREASALTGSGANAGGRTHFDDAFAKLRYANPFRMGARVTKNPNMSSVAFVAKTGNAANATNPWGYEVNPNSGNPNIATTFWQLPTRVITAQLPVRTATLDDINGLETELIEDLTLEFGQLEGESIAVNNDQAGSDTFSTGAEEGLRGLDSYKRDPVSAFGLSGPAMTDGLHLIATVDFSGLSTDQQKYAGIASVADALPAQYWCLPTTAWHVKPSFISTLRQLVDDSKLPMFLDIGEPNEAGALGSIFGWPVIPNPYLSDDFPLYLANWDRFLTISDVEEMTIQMMEETAPGFVTMYAEKRMVSTVKDPFAGVRIAANAPESASIDPEVGEFDLYDPIDVTTEITFNDASNVASVVGAAPLVLDEDYTVSGIILTVLVSYLETLSVGVVPLTINFNIGDAATLTVTVIDTTPP